MEINDKPVVSVVIPTYNSWPSLRLCLKGLLQQDYPRDAFEVIVVDDGSTDGTEKNFKEMRLPPSFVYFYQKNRKQAAARNLGIKHSAGRYILFLDADVIPKSHLVQAHVSRHLSSKNVFVEGKIIPLLQSSPNRSQFKALEILKARKEKRKKLEFTCITWNLSVKKEDLYRAGLFNEDFTAYGYEDFELGYRLCKNLGLQLVYEEKAVAYHANKDNPEITIQKAWENGISFVRFIRLHPDILKQKKWPTARRNFSNWMQQAKSFFPITFPMARHGFRTLKQLISLCERSNDPTCRKTLSAWYKQLVFYSFFEGTYTALMDLPKKGPLFKQKNFKPEDYLCRIDIEVKAPAKMLSSAFFRALKRHLKRNGFNAAVRKSLASPEISLKLPGSPPYKINHAGLGKSVEGKITDGARDKSFKDILQQLYRIARIRAKRSKEYSST